MNHLVNDCKIVSAISPATNASGITGDYVSLKNCLKAFVVVNITQGNAATIEIGINQATAVAGTSAAAIAKTMPIWSDLDCGASDTLVKRTAAATYTTDAALADKLVVFQVDPAILSSGFDCIAVTIGASNVANIVSAEYILEQRYLGESTPSAIVD